MSNVIDWVPFTHRYGWNKDYLDDRQHWTKRHAGSHRGPECSPSDRVRCVCPGSQSIPSTRPECCARASQEDHLCDACRKHCVAVDSGGRYHRFMDLASR